MNEIGFIGLGRMGKWMASNLLKRGFALHVFDIDAAALALLAERGATPAPTAAALAQRVDTIVLSLPNSEVVETVVRGQDAVLQGARPGLVLVDCGTAGYRWTREFADSLQSRGLHFVDAPVTGLEQKAKDGTLTIMFGGAADLFEQVRPVLAAMGSNIIHMGETGSGQLAKMLNNILYNANMAALAEVLPMAVKLGLAPERIAEVVNSGSGRSFASEFFIPQILDGTFDRSYSMANAYKDMANAAETAAHYEIRLPMIEAATATYRQALAMGLGAEGKGAMIKVFEEKLKVAFRKGGESCG